MGSCEPFKLSSFPGFLTDLDEYLDLSGFFSGGDVEHYELFTLNNGPTEYVCLLAVFYSGNQSLYIFDDTLTQLGVSPLQNDLFGSRHFRDINGNFVVGSQVLDPFFASGPQINEGKEGQGGTFNDSSVLKNTVINSTNGFSLTFRFYLFDWSALNGLPYDVNIGTGPSSHYYLSAVRRVDSINATVLLLRESSDSENRGYAVILNTLANVRAYTFLLFNAPTLSLGDIEDEVYIANEGVIAKGRDGLIRLFGWDNKVIASTRAYSSEGKVLIEYGFNGFYYVFDPGTMKLYKARNWWQKQK
jgi:hypothetical protein